jgi:hypothetical protein
MPTTEETKYPGLGELSGCVSICTDLDRTTRRERALSAAGFRVVSANTFQAASAMSQYCPFRVVVLDHECCSELASLVLGTPYVILDTEPQANEEDLVQDLLALCARRGWFNKLEPLRAA